MSTQFRACLSSVPPAVEGSSDRGFGVVFAVVLTLVGAWPLLDGAPPRWWAFALAAGFAAVAAVRPSWLALPNRGWTRLGEWLGRLVSPIALAIVFYGVLTPVALVARLRGKDPLRLTRDRHAATHWVPREPPGPPPQSMTHPY